MSSTIFRNKNLMRPRKSAAQRSRRMKEQQARLIAGGADPKAVCRLNACELRTALKAAARA